MRNSIVEENYLEENEMLLNPGGEDSEDTGGGGTSGSGDNER